MISRREYHCAYSNGHVYRGTAITKRYYLRPREGGQTKRKETLILLQIRLLVAHNAEHSMSPLPAPTKLGFD